MSGKPGRSGGARPNSGPKPKRLNETAGGLTPLEFLLQVMNDDKLDANTRLRAAIAACQYVHPKRGEGGKKDEQDKAADEAGSGRFAPAVPPKLVVSNN